jgi:chromosome segregation ATPase
MATKLAIRPKAVPGDSHRAELRRCISERGEIKRTLSVIAAAQESARRDARQLADEAAAAKVAVSEAEKRATDNTVASAMGKPAAPGKSVAEARAGLAELEDKLSASKSARSLLDAKLKATQSELEHADADVVDAANLVLAASPEMARLLADWTTTVKTYRQLSHVVDHFALVVPEQLRNLSRALVDNSDFEVVEKWKSAAHALLSDASVELPD